MKKPTVLGADWGDAPLEVLWEDADRVFGRLPPHGGAGSQAYAFIPVLSDTGHPSLESIDRLAHEYELKDYLDAEWALRPVMGEALRTFWRWKPGN